MPNERTPAYLASQSSFTILGHRGAKGHAPENTLPSFEKAIVLGATMTELDIHLSKDGRLIVMHDADVSRTTNGCGQIQEMTLAQIKQLDAGQWFGPSYAGTTVPTLQEVIALIKGRILLNIEVKKGAAIYPGIVQKMVDVLKETNMVEQTVVSSFQPEYLHSLMTLLPEANAALLCNTVEDVIPLAVSEGWSAIHPNVKSVTQEFVCAAHASGLLVRAWNPNDVEEMRRLLACGVDGIGTDYPERLLQILKERA